MGDEQDRHAALLLKAANQVEYLTPQAHVQRSGGLIGQQQPGLASQCHGDHGALALATTELMRISIGASSRVCNTGIGDQLNGFGPSLGARQPHFQLQNLNNLLAYR